MNKVRKSPDHSATFKYLFDCDQLEDDILLIKLDYEQLDKVLKHVSEFAYQVYKILSKKEGLEYKLE